MVGPPEAGINEGPQARSNGVSDEQGSRQHRDRGGDARDDGEMAAAVVQQAAREE